AVEGGAGRLVRGRVPHRGAGHPVGRRREEPDRIVQLVADRPGQLPVPVRQADRGAHRAPQDRVDLGAVARGPDRRRPVPVRIEDARLPAQQVRPDRETAGHPATPGTPPGPATPTTPAIPGDPAASDGEARPDSPAGPAGPVTPVGQAGAASPVAALGPGGPATPPGEARPRTAVLAEFKTGATPPGEARPDAPAGRLAPVGRGSPPCTTPTTPNPSAA